MNNLNFVEFLVGDSHQQKDFSERNPFRYHIINLLENFSSGVVFGLLLGAALVS